MPTAEQHAWVKDVSVGQFDPADSTRYPPSAGAAPAAASGSVPSIFLSGGTTTPYLAALDNFKSYPMLPVNGKPVKTATLIADTTKQLSDGITHALRCLHQLYPDARDFLAAKRSGADLVNASVNDAAGKIKEAQTDLQAQQFVYCHDAITSALKNVMIAQNAIDAYTRKQTANADLAVNILTGVRNGCEEALSTLAPLLGPGAVAIVATFNEALNDCDDAAVGKPVNLGKSAAKIILPVVLAKFGDAFNKALDDGLGPLVTKSLGPYLAEGTKAVDEKFITIYVRDKIKDGWEWLLEAEAGSIYASATGQKKPTMIEIVQDFFKDIRSGKMFQEKSAAEVIKKLVEEALEHTVMPKKK